MKRLFLFLALMLLALPARADFPDRVRSDLPRLLITVTAQDNGDSADRPYTLTAHIAAEDGSFTQALTWQSNETPAHDRVAALVLLVDYNFDGYCDLQLLTAAGARNVLYTFALWNPDTGRFDEATGMEVCNPVFDAESRTLLSARADGWAYRTETLYGWEGRWLTPQVIVAVGDAGDGLIRESLEIRGTGVCIMWDQVYPESWYYGDDGEGASGPRERALDLFLRGDGRSSPRYMQVANVSWVNLRERDSKSSVSLARLNQGTTVQVLQTGCGEDGGWVLVWCSNSDLGLPVPPNSYQYNAPHGLTGYIWHSYLEPAIYRVAHVSWVNLRQAPDKASPSLA